MTIPANTASRGKQMTSAVLRVAAAAAVLVCWGYAADAGATVPTRPAAADCQSAPPSSAAPKVCWQRGLAFGRSDLLIDGQRVRATLRYDYYAPATKRRRFAKGRRPWVLLIFGSAFITEWGVHGRASLSTLAQWYAARGFTAILADYLTLPEARVADPADDDEIRIGDDQGRLRDPGGLQAIATEAQRNQQTMIRYAKEHHAALGLDPADGHALGVSSGALIALRVASRPHDVGDVAARSLNPNGRDQRRTSSVRDAISVSSFDCSASPDAFKAEHHPTTGVAVTFGFTGCAPPTDPTGAPVLLWDAHHDSYVAHAAVTKSCDVINAASPRRRPCSVFTPDRRWYASGVITFQTGGHWVLFDARRRPTRYTIGGKHVFDAVDSPRNIILNTSLRWMRERHHPNATR